MPFPNKKRNLPSWGIFVLIFLPPILFLLAIPFDLYHDMVMVRTNALRGEMEKLRMLLARRSGRLEQIVERQDSSANTIQDLASQKNAERLFEIDSADSEAYWAVVDPHGRIAFHSKRELIGKQVLSDWDDIKEPTVGNDVVRISNSPLTGGVDSYDVSLPIQLEGASWGLLHSGVEATSLDDRIARQRRDLVLSRLWGVVPLGLLNLASIAAGAYLAIHCRDMRAILGFQKSSEAENLAQIGLGLAHEVRNPLHALRLNIHTLKRSLTTKLLSEQEMVEMMRESADEIDRMELLMRDLVQYAAPQAQEPSVDIDLERELRATLQMLDEDLKRESIELTLPSSDVVFMVRMAPTALRLTLSELLTFSKRSASRHGRLTVDLERRGDRAILSITDSGRDLSPKDLAKLFEPFQSTPFSNAGLALALVQRFVKEAGGTLERIQSTGANRFVLDLPLAKDSTHGVA